MNADELGTIVGNAANQAATAVLEQQQQQQMRPPAASSSILPMSQMVLVRRDLLVGAAENLKAAAAGMAHCKVFLQNASDGFEATEGTLKRASRAIQNALDNQ